MTRNNLLVVVGLATLALSLAFVSACSDSEQQAAVKRQKRIEMQEQEDARHKSAAPQETADEMLVREAKDREARRAEADAERLANPTYVENYQYWPERSSTGVVCHCYEQTSCGMTFYGCNDGRVYACMHNAIYKVVQVNETEDNKNGQCAN